MPPDAGRRAHGQLLLPAGLPVRAALLAEDQDPDSLLRDQDQKASSN